MNKEIWEKFTNKNYVAVLQDANKVMNELHALDYVHVSGLALIGLGKIDEGVDWVAASLSLAQAVPDWFVNAANSCMDKKQWGFAVMFLMNGLKEYPNNLVMTYMQGMCHVNMHEWAMAIGFLNECIRIDEDFFPHAMLGIGFCHHMLGRYNEALECYGSVKTSDREQMEAVHNNYACVLMELSRHQEALDYLNTNCPGTERPGTLYNLAFLYLGLRQWDIAWPLYRYRNTVTALPGQVGGGGLSDITAIPAITGMPFARSLQEIFNKNLLLIHEQGLGDTIQFVRYARLFEPIAKSITIAVPVVLERLINHLEMPLPFKVVASDRDIGYCDVALPMLDAPILFETMPNEIPEFGPYIHVPAELVEEKRLSTPTLNEPSSDNKKIGVIWAGATRIDNIRAHSIDRRRSVPFETFSYLLDIPGADFYSLQLPDHHRDHPNLIRVLDEKSDVLDTAAFMMHMDLIITIDSAMVHLAGALGRPVWMLSRFDQCWRWGWNKETTSPWYPTLKIYQQTAHNTWSDIIAFIQIDLIRWLHPEDCNVV